MSQAPDAPTPGWAALWREGYATPILMCAFGVWLHAADGLMVATMIPSIIADIGGAQWIAWTVALYELGSIIAGGAAALIAIRHGLRGAMTGAALLYAAGCALSAIAPTMEAMLAGRLAQGLGGGALVALSMLAISQLFPPHFMPRAMAAISMVWGLSAFTGPLVGGVFVEFGHWRGGFWAFAAQAALLAIWLQAALARRPRPVRETSAARFPVRRLAVLAAGVLCIASAGINVAPLRSTLLIVAGLALLVAFLRLDARAGTDRMLPRRAISLRDRAGAGLTMVICMSAATIPLGVYGPVLMTILHGTPAIVAGYVLALESIGWALAAMATSGGVRRNDGRRILTGMALATVSVPALMWAMVTGPVALIGAFALVAGAAFGVAWTFILRRLVSLASGDEADRLSTALPTVQRFGYALGAALVGVVANAVGFAETADASTARTTTIAIFAAMLPLAALGLAAAWRFTRDPNPGPAPTTAAP